MRQGILQGLMKSLFVSGQQTQEDRKEGLGERMASRRPRAREEGSKHLQSHTEGSRTTILMGEEEDNQRDKECLKAPHFLQFMEKILLKPRQMS